MATTEPPRGVQLIEVRDGVFHIRTWVITEPEVFAAIERIVGADTPNGEYLATPGAGYVNRIEL